MKFYVLVFLQSSLDDTLFIESRKYPNQWNAVGGELAKHSDELSVEEAVVNVLRDEVGITLLPEHPRPELFAHLRGADYCVFCYRVKPDMDWVDFLMQRKEETRQTAWFYDAEVRNTPEAFAPHMAELIRLSRLPVDGDIVPSIVD